MADQGGEAYSALAIGMAAMARTPVLPEVTLVRALFVQVFGRRHHGRRLLLRRPASKKREGTKSRKVWGRVGSQCYGDLIFASIMTVGAKLAPGDLDRVRKGSWKRAIGISVAA
jgi:hypothetical protein